MAAGNGGLGRDRCRAASRPIALFVWLNVEDGVVRAFAFNVMVIGGVSTILFNGNPLLRFDGYYVLSDVLKFPISRIEPSATLVI